MISQNWYCGLPSSVGSGTFMPNRPVITVIGPNSAAITASTFETSASRFETRRQVRIEDAGHAILKHDRVVRHAHELIVDVAEPVGHFLADQVEFAPGQPADHVALRHDDAAQRRDVALDRQDVAGHRLGRRLDDVLFDLVEPFFELVDLRPIVIDHRVDDAMQQRDRAFAEHVLRARADLADVRDAAPLAVVDGDEEVRRQEEIGFVRVEAMLDGIEVDAVEHDVEIVAVGLDFRIGLALKGRFDDQLVQAEDARAARRRLPRSVPPHPPTPRRRCRAQQPRRVEAVDQFGPTASVDEVANQSPTLTLNAACAAARRATGTRYGEQLT